MKHKDDTPYLFPHPEQKRAYYRFCDELPSIKFERLIKMVGELDQKPEDKLYLEAVQWELRERATKLINERADNVKFSE